MTRFEVTTAETVCEIYTVDAADFDDAQRLVQDCGTRARLAELGHARVSHGLGNLEVVAVRMLREHLDGEGLKP